MSDDKIGGTNTPPVAPVPSTTHVIALLQTADAIRRHFNALVRSEGLTLQQYNVLRVLRDAGSGGLPTMLIGERMVEQTPGLTRIVAKLQTASLIRRTRSRTDKRLVLCRLTPAGLELLGRLDPSITAAEASLSAALNKGDSGRMATMLTAIHATVSDPS